MRSIQLETGIFFSLAQVAVVLLVGGFDLHAEGQEKVASELVYEAVPNFEPVPPEKIPSIRAHSADEEGFNLTPPRLFSRDIRPILEVLEEKYPERFESPETICGEDTRQPATGVGIYPKSVNCFLRIKVADGLWARGTGWLVAPNLVITAGHCVHDGAGGNFFEQVEVFPGAANSAEGPVTPFGSQSSTKLFAAEGWRTNGSTAGDYGAILLDTGFENADGEAPGVYDVAIAPDELMNGAKLNMFGYPGDKPIGQMWFAGGEIFRLDPARLFYKIDTYRGMSGSAVMLTYSDGRRMAVGIHNYGGCPNKATRITDEVMADLNAWRQEAAQRLAANTPDTDAEVVVDRIMETEPPSLLVTRANGQKLRVFLNHKTIVTLDGNPATFEAINEGTRLSVVDDPAIGGARSVAKSITIISSPHTKK